MIRTGWLAGLVLMGCPAPMEDDTDTDAVCEAQALVSPTEDFFVDISEQSGIQDQNYDWTQGSPSAHERPSD